MASIHDPTGLLGRIPELEPLIDHPPVRHAIERGDPHRLYRVLFWSRMFGRMRAHAATIRLLLERRRLFLRPLGSAPKLITYNGTGTTAYGRADFDPNDGTYILTQFFTVFFVPIFPLRQFLVRDAASSGRKRAWHFIGTVPRGPVTYFWNRLLALGLVLSIVPGAFATWEAMRHHDVHFVNGLNFPVRVEFAGRMLDVAASGHEVRRVRVGSQTARILREDGALIEQADIDVRAGTATEIVNVLGAAPVYRETIVYAAKDEPPATVPNTDAMVGCGETVISYEGVDDAFVDPPKTVTMSSESKMSTRVHVGVAPGGAAACINYLAGSQRPDQALHLAQRVAELTRFDDVDATTAAVSMMAELSGPEAAFAWAEKAVAAQPKSVDLQRVYQTIGIAAGKRKEMLVRYADLYQKEPNAADRGYLLARLESPSEAASLLDDLTSRFPDHAPSQRARAFVEFELGHFEQAIAWWRRLQSRAPDEWREQLQSIVRAMVGAGRTDEALDEIETALSDPKADRLGLTELYVRVARLAERDIEPVLRRATNDLPGSRVIALRVRAGLPVSPAQLATIENADARVAATITLRAAQSPDDALDQVVHASQGALRSLDEETWALLYAEAARRDGDGAPARALVASARRRAQVARAMRSFLETGAVDVDLADEPFETRAAVEFARSRVASLPARERGVLLASAAHDDLLHGIVTRAIHGWK